MNARTTWLAERRKGLGGSDIAPILGLSKFRSAWDVWLDKTGQAPDEEDDGKWIWRRGHLLEAALLQAYGEEHGLDVALNATSLVGPVPWLRGTPDAIVGTEGYADGKTTLNWAAWGEAGDCHTVADTKGRIPDDVACQGYHYLGMDPARMWLDFVVLFVPFQLDKMLQATVEGLDAAGVQVEGTEIGEALAKALIAQCEVRVYRLHRDDVAIAHIQRHAAAWWQLHVVDGERPPVDSSKGCRRALDVVSGQNEGERVNLQAEGDVVDLLADGAAAKRLRDDSKAAYDLAANRLKAAMLDAGADRVWAGGVSATLTRGKRRALKIETKP